MTWQVVSFLLLTLEKYTSIGPQFYWILVLLPRLQDQGSQVFQRPTELATIWPSQHQKPLHFRSSTSCSTFFMELATGGLACSPIPNPFQFSNICFMRLWVDLANGEQRNNIQRKQKRKTRTSESWGMRDTGAWLGKWRLGRWVLRNVHSLGQLKGTNQDWTLQKYCSPNE